MVERPTTLVDVTRSDPCPGRREELLSLAALRSESPLQAAARRHLAGCRRCSAFLASVQLELRLGFDAFSELRARHHPNPDPPFDLARSKSFTAWLEGELEERSELELARAMTRAARYLHMLDPEVEARVVVVDTDDWRQSPSSQRSCSEALAAQLAAQLSSARFPARLKQPLGDDLSELLGILRRAIEAEGVSRRARIQLAKRLMSRAEQLSDGQLGSTWLQRGVIEWFDGDQSVIETCFIKAERHSEAPRIRALSLMNLGVLCSDRGRDTDRFDFVDRALATRPIPTIARSLLTTRMCWLAARGRMSSALADLDSIARIGQLAETRRRTPPRMIQSTLNELASRYEHQPRRVERARVQLTEALHGNA